MSDLAKPHDRDELLARLHRMRKKPVTPERPGAAERAAQREAEMAAIRAVAIPPPASDAELKQAARLLVQRIAAIGKEHLAKNPSRDPPSEREDDFRATVSDEGWNGLVPLFDALAKAMESPSADGTKYRYGFLLRLIEGTLDVAKIAGPDAITMLREQQRRGGRDGGGRAAKERAEERHKQALPIAIELRQSQPRLSQESLATEIKFTLDLKVGVRTIMADISEWERDGKLNRMTK
jgi:hypothetical protein